MKIIATVAGGLLATGLFASAAGAAPLGNFSKDAAPSADPLVQLVHNVHRACSVGPNGWHFHTRRGVRVACRPVRPGRYWTWRSEGGRNGWWHSRERRWH